MPERRNGVRVPERTARRYARTSLPLGVDPITAGVGLTRIGDGPFVLYERPREVGVGFGAAAEIVLDRHHIRLRTDGDWRRVPTGDEPLQRIGELLADTGIPDWRVYGWLGFELSYLLHGMPEAAGDTVLGHLVVPAVEARLTAGNAELRALRLDDLADLCDRVERLEQPAEPRPSVELTDDLAGGEEYQKIVAAAVADIKDRRLRKVILSRVVPVRGTIDLPASYRAGRRGNTPARSFLLELGELRAVGFSPETVVEVCADGTVSTQPLAGTRALSGDLERDAQLREELLNDPKEIYEHAVSVHGAQHELGTVCTPGSVLVEEFMGVRQRGSVQHLASRVTGRLAPERNGWHALTGLFPAVTASGLPKAAACEAIHRYEPGERGLYSGVVLTADADGALDAALVLRTVFQQGGRTWLRAGAGIVEQSTPERELEETREKLRSISRFLVPVAEQSPVVTQSPVGSPVELDELDERVVVP
ncbi:MAG TPA: salicylate synthase [Pseudonocardia sp.]|jgi:salicylate synthase|nr:salicylate synthase [Pseudonocardia sp.]